LLAASQLAVPAKIIKSILIYLSQLYSQRLYQVLIEFGQPGLSMVVDNKNAFDHCDSPNILKLKN
jgi:hypothetical protein